MSSAFQLPLYGMGKDIIHEGTGTPIQRLWMIYEMYEATNFSDLRNELFLICARAKSNTYRRPWRPPAVLDPFLFLK